ALVDLIAGHVKTAMLTWPSVAEHVRAGRLIALAITSAERMPYIPELPTLRELGHRDFVSLTWFSLSGPAAMPTNVVEAINREVVKAMDQPHIRQQIARDAIEVRPMTPAELARFAQGEIDRWTPLITRIMATRQ